MQQGGSMAKKSNKIPFDKRGGVLVINRRMLNSTAYQSLNSNQKVLILLLHEQWRNDKAVSYGVREAAQKIHCRPNTASMAFSELQNRKFIVCVEQSNFNSRTGSKARDWHLTWMPYMDKPPTNDWEKWSDKN